MRDKDCGGDWVTGEFKTASLTGSNFPGIADGIWGEEKQGFTGCTLGGVRVVIVGESSGPAASRESYRPSSPLMAGRKRRRRGPEMRAGARIRKQSAAYFLIWNHMTDSHAATQ